jgi:hypothetical protein
MALPTPAVAVPNIATDPGVLFWAPLGSAEPTHAVTASVFSDSWPVAWLALGATANGSNFKWKCSFDKIEVEEFLDPIRYVTTGREGSVAFALASINATNMKRALNGGTLTTTGATTTTMTSYTPPAAGAEVRCMIGWESLDSTERLICYQTINTAEVSINRQKGKTNAVIPVEFALEIPVSGIPFKYLTAGVARA